jgi:hypothetical protein
LSPQLKTACQFCDDFNLSHLEQSSDGRADQVDGFHGRHRVIERGRIDHSFAADEPGNLGRLARYVKEAVWML